MKLLHIKETCIYVQDLDKTTDFYHGKLSLEIILKADGKHVFFRAGSSVLLCFITAYTEQQTTTPPHGAAGKIHFAFEVERADYEDTKQEILGKGIVIEHEHEWKDKLLSFYFRDPDGHLLEIAQKGIWD